MASAGARTLRKLAVDAVNVSEKRVLVRVDFNVPMKDVRRWRHASSESAPAIVHCGGYALSLMNVYHFLIRVWGVVGDAAHSLVASGLHHEHSAH